MIIRKFLRPFPTEPHMRYLIIYEREKPRFLYRRGRCIPLNHEAFEMKGNWLVNNNFNE